MARPPAPDDFEALDAAADAAENVAAAEGTDAPEQMGGKKRSITNVLLHTQPDLSVSQTQRQLGVDEGPAHFVIAGRKALDALTDAESGSGTTVLEHVIIGSVNMFDTPADSDEPDEPNESDEPTDADDLGPVVA